MNRNTKLTLMFLPLAVFFVVLMVVVQDARQPQISRDQCKILAAGPAAQAHLPETGKANYLYRHSENPLYELALQCQAMQNKAFINDEQLLQTPVKHGQKADLTIKTYKFLPQRHLLSIHTGSVEANP